MGLSKSPKAPFVAAVVASALLVQVVLFSHGTSPEMKIQQQLEVREAPYRLAGYSQPGLNTGSSSSTYNNGPNRLSGYAQVGMNNYPEAGSSTTRGNAGPQRLGGGWHPTTSNWPPPAPEAARMHRRMQGVKGVTGLAQRQDKAGQDSVKKIHINIEEPKSAVPRAVPARFSQGSMQLFKQLAAQADHALPSNRIGIPSDQFARQYSVKPRVEPEGEADKLKQQLEGIGYEQDKFHFIPGFAPKYGPTFGP
mmetsp:Transcript_14047/g.21865  ORF Transcript_14047/g.21865 Transcript_14047/m.21865 type:complete len:251 (-) Transcript_14047:58-810(-)